MCAPRSHGCPSSCPCARSSAGGCQSSRKMVPSSVPMAINPVPFGKYELITRLAAGGMAEIFLARTKSIQGFEKYLVIKKILKSRTSDQEFVRMFLDEARLAATLDHPNVI